jgi:rieske iron-sulfur protein
MNHDGLRSGRPPATVGESDGPLATRRRFLKAVIGLGSLAFTAAFLLPALALKTLSRAQKTITRGDVLVYAQGVSGALAGQPVKAADLQVGRGVQAFPQGKTDNQKNLIEVVRVAPGRGAQGVVAYSAICTHLGCAVYAQLNQQGLIACPCHGSLYDPRHGARVVGGPAPRPLPAIPVTVGDGEVLATNGAFSGPIGPQ